MKAGRLTIPQGLTLEQLDEFAEVLALLTPGCESVGHHVMGYRYSFLNWDARGDLDIVHAGPQRTFAC